MKIRAIIFGATGMVGEGVLHEALRHEDVEAVLVVGRRPCGTEHPKLTEIILPDVGEVSAISREAAGYNACFFCLGVSSIGMREDEYRRITYDLTLSVARTLCRLNPLMTFCYVSGAGTDSTERGRSMWARVKGKTENDLARLPFRAVYNFRPGFIRPTPGLRNAFRLSRILGKIYPLLHLLFPAYVCTLEDLGSAMIRLSAHGYSRTIIGNREITDLGAENAHS